MPYVEGSTANVEHQLGQPVVAVKFLEREKKFMTLSYVLYIKA
jgi:hypothetical protein